jgi:hypothetical protein
VGGGGPSGPSSDGDGMLESGNNLGFLVGVPFATECVPYDA